MDLSRSTSVILFSLVVFFGRRVLFIVSVLYMTTFLWAQLTLQLAVSSVVIIYLVKFKPLESTFQSRMELMNEITLILLVYCMILFTDYVAEAATRYQAGFAFLAIAGSNITVHLTFLVWEVLKSLFGCCLWCKQALKIG